MAERLKQSEYAKVPPGRPPNYPWALWFNGEIWRIKQGVDFDVKMNSMEVSIRRTAARYQKKITVSREDDTTFIIKPREEKRANKT